jgi:hypothetical protein
MISPGILKSGLSTKTGIARFADRSQLPKAKTLFQRSFETVSSCWPR